MTKNICSIDGCDRRVGYSETQWCKVHHRRWERNGSPYVGGNISRDDPMTFWGRVEIRVDGCWLWKGRTNRGYGRFILDGIQVLAHRFAYELLIGPIPEGLVIDHLCRNPTCVRPDHMDPTTRVKNWRKGYDDLAAVGALRRKSGGSFIQTHCKRGHPFNAENTHIAKKSGQRVCRVCCRERMTAYYQTEAGKAARNAGARRRRAAKKTASV